ncbi:unnamed protein product [Musa acuminata var. zebrina]
MALMLLPAIAPADISVGLGFTEAVRQGERSLGKVFTPRRRRRWNLQSLYADSKYACVEFEPENTMGLPPPLSSLVTSTAAEAAVSLEQKVYDVILKQSSLVKKKPALTTALDVKPDLAIPGSLSLLKEAYDRCGEVYMKFSCIFVGTLLLTPERRRAIWAIYVWCRRTDELVDGPNASHITPTALGRWESRLEDVFAGCPYDMLDAALSDTVSKYPCSCFQLQPFRDMIEGMRIDLNMPRYQNFDELYLYCYYVAGTVGLMSVPVMGSAPESKATAESVYRAALALGIANQLTNRHGDVGEDARRGRIYLPQDELARFGLSDDEIFDGKVTDKWRSFMKNQIKRARMFFGAAEDGVSELNQASRWRVWASLLLHQQILDEIEANDYNNFTKRASASKAKKLMALPVAFGRSLVTPSSLRQSSSAKTRLEGNLCHWIEPPTSEKKML